MSEPINARNPSSFQAGTSENVVPIRRIKYDDSQAKVERQLTWDAINRAHRKSLSCHRRAALRYLVNCWFANRSSKGYIAPSAEILARKTSVSVRTAKTALKEFREAGFITAIRYAKGGRKATWYTLDYKAIWTAYGTPVPTVVEGDLEPVERPRIPWNKTVQTGVETVQKLHANIYSDVPQPWEADGISLRDMERHVWGTAA